MSGIPGFGEDLSAMQIRCPHCHHPIEVVDEKLFEALACPSCGSNITLISKDTTVAHEPTSDGNTVALKPRRLGHFELLEQVGVGGFGAVWKARDTVLDRIVAVKVPRRSQLTSAEAEYFLRDARAAAQLRHPNIVSVHEVGRDGETFFIASDFVDGANLHDWLSARKLTVRESAELVAQIADAVQHAHERGVVHRDLKPGNILMDGAGRPHVTDFGLAKRETGEITMTVDGQILGTPAYMSPEQARGKAHEADARSDVYSLGVILFELLTGELPFRGEKRMLIVQILNDEPPSPRKLNSRVPRDLETICLKCLEKEPKKRYASTAELAGDLRRFLSGETIQARPVGRLERGWRWCKRQPVVAGLSAAVILSLATGILSTSTFAMRASHRETMAMNESKRAEREKVRAQCEQSRTQTQLLRAEWLLYASNIASAQREWELESVGTAWRHLNSCRSDLRGWEFDYLETLFNKNQRTFLGHAQRVNCVAFSPDGHRAASGDDNGSLVVWDTTSLQALHTIRAPSNVTCVAFSPDGTRVLCGCGGSHISSHEVRQAASGGTISIFDAESGGELLTFRAHRMRVTDMAISADGTRIASCEGFRDTMLRVWDTTTGKEVLLLDGHQDTLTCLAYSPDSQQIAAGTDSGNVIAWDAQSGKHIWDLRGGQPLRMLGGHDGAVICLKFSPDNALLISASHDRSVRVWSAVNGQERGKLDIHTQSKAVDCLDFSADGRRIVTGSTDGLLECWDVASGKRVHSLKGHGDGILCLARDQKDAIVTGSRDMTCKVWDIGKTQEVLTVFDPKTASVKCVTFSFDGLRVFSGDFDGKIKSWDATVGNELATLGRHAAPVQQLAMSVDGTRLVSCSEDKTIKVWDVTSGVELQTFTGHSDTVRGVAFDKEGRRLVSGSYDQTVKVWDFATGGLLLTLTGSTKAKVNCVAVSPVEGLAASGSDDGTIRLWSLRNGEELCQLRGHSAGVLSVSFSPDGSRIASSSYDHTAKVCEVDPENWTT